MSDIFKDRSFGGTLRDIRIENNLTMREMCKLCAMDVGNYSRLEASRLSPPRSKQAILKIVKNIKCDEFKKNWLVDAAYSFHLGALRERFK